MTFVVVFVMLQIRDPFNQGWHVLNHRLKIPVFLMFETIFFFRVETCFFCIFFEV